MDMFKDKTYMIILGIIIVIAIIFVTHMYIKKSVKDELIKYHKYQKKKEKIARRKMQKEMEKRELIQRESNKMTDQMQQFQQRHQIEPDMESYMDPVGMANGGVEYQSVPHQ